jgi:hypothetical protein
MKTNTLKDIAEILDRNDYRVTMTKTDNGCIAHFPQRVELPLRDFARLYQEFDRHRVLICTYDEDGQEIEKCHVDCPPYAQSLFTIYHVIYCCIGIGYDLPLVKFVVDGNEVDDEVFLKENKGNFAHQVDATRESALNNLIETGLRVGFQPQHEQMAEQEGVLEGFRVIRGLFVTDQMVKQLEQGYE